jgi:acyl-coenzyme A synthetase/AMP-(fatty) acid ligase
VVIANPIRHIAVCLALYRIHLRAVSLEHSQPGIHAVKLVAILGDAAAGPLVDSANRFVEVTNDWFGADPPITRPLPGAFSNADDIFRYSFTSGSTGVPKLVPRRVEGTSRTILKFLDVNWNVVLDMPGLAVHWGFMTACAALSTGRTVCFAVSPFQAIRMIELFSIDFVIATTEQLLALTRVARTSGAQLKSLRTIMTAGSVPSRLLLESAMIHLCNNILCRYGAAEMGAIAQANARDVLANPGLAGQVAPEISVAIFDRAGKECPSGQIGIVHARHHGDAPWVNLEDAGWLTPDGRLFVVGRAHDLGSEAPHLSPVHEIEHLVRLEWDVDDAAVVVENRGAGVKPRASVAVVGNRIVTAETLGLKLKGRGIDCEVIVHYVDAIPRTTSGKINRPEFAAEMKSRASRPG